MSGRITRYLRWLRAHARAGGPPQSAVRYGSPYGKTPPGAYGKGPYGQATGGTVLYPIAGGTPERLPVVGSDIDSWGGELNNYLRVNHGTDGALNAYPLASLPPAGTAGRLFWLTDDVMGVMVDNGGRIRQLQGNVINVLDKGTDAAALQAAHDSLPSTGGTILIPSNTTIALGTTRVNFSKNIVLMGFGWTSKITADVTALADPGGNDRGILNIRHADSGSALDYVKIYNLWMDFGGSRSSTYAEGRRGLNVYRSNNVDIRGCQFKGGVGEMVGLDNFGTPENIRHWIIGNFFTDWAQDALNANGNYTHIVANTFLTGDVGIESSTVTGLYIIGNDFEDLNSQAMAVQAIGLEVMGNTGRNVMINLPAAALGAISIYNGGSAGPATDGTVSNNSFSHAASSVNRVGILLQRGTATSDNARINVNGNTMNGYGTGIQTTSLLDGSIVNNTLIGAAAGVGIYLASATQVARNDVHGNNIRNFTTLIQDDTAAVDANIVGYNIQDNKRVLGIDGIEGFTDLDATPSVRKPGIFTASYTGATTITNFDDGAAGQEITILFTGATPNITVQDNANVQLSGGVDFVSTTDDSLTLVLQGTVWREKSRSVN